MEQMYCPEQTICRDSRLYCQSDSCAKPCINYCSDHGQILCDNCSVDFHGECNCDQIPDKSDVAESLDVIKTFLNFIQKNSEHFKSSFNNNNFDEELMMFCEMHEKIDEKFKSLTKVNEFYELSSIMKEVNQLQKALYKSDLLAHFRKDKEVRQAVAAGSLSHKMVADFKRMLNDVTQIGNSKYNKFDTKTVDKKLSFKSTTDDFMQTNPTIDQTQRASNFVVEPEQKMHVVAELDADERKKIEKDIYLQEREIQSVVFSRIYERNINRKISDILYFYFSINLKMKNDRNLLKDLSRAKLRLPDLRAIQIGGVSDSDKDLVSFLEICTPDQLKLLRFNFLSYSSSKTKAKFYMRLLPKLANVTTEEVFLNRLEFSETELEQIVKSSCNANTLVFEGCDIHCSTVLDFGSALKYKTKTINFQFCGNTADSNRKADWVSSPACFGNIIEAISKSGLRDSLQTICIAYNQTLSVEKVLQTLNEKGMPHVTISQEFLCIIKF